MNAGLLVTRNQVRWFVHNGNDGTEFESCRGSEAWDYYDEFNDLNVTIGCLGNNKDIVGL